MLARINSINFASAVCLALLFNFSSLLKLTLASASELRGFPTGEREGGGTRGEASRSCYSNQQPPIPLIPENSLGLTASASPTLFFYVPQSEQPQELEFVLFDKNDNIVRRETFRANNRAGIVSLSLPTKTTSDALVVDQHYRWYLIENCNFEYQPKVVVSGSLQRIELDRNLVTQLERAASLERVTLYQEANVWHEALSNLAELRCDLPHNSVVADRWTELLNSVGLDSLSQESLDPYCSQKSKLQLELK